METEEDNDTGTELKYYQRQMDKIGGELINADSKITLLNRNLKQKNDGFRLLSELLDEIGTDTDVHAIYKTTLNHINEHLRIDTSIILEQTIDGSYSPRWHLGIKKAGLEDLALNLSELENAEIQHLLVNRQSDPSELELKIQETLEVRFFIGVPIYINGLLTNYLIASRKKEAQPFYPPFNQGDIETFTSIAGFLSSALTNHSLYHSLSQAKKTVEEYNVTLEEKVEERTLTIKEKNEKLQDLFSEITNSITYAKRIQTAILPNDHLIKRLLPNSYVLYLPKDIVAGDFYWIEEQGDLVMFSAADCTGHGVPGAMVSVVCHNALDRAVREYGLSKPGEILDKTREMVIETFSNNNDESVKDGMDASLCSYDRSTGKLYFSGANNSLYLIRAKEEGVEIGEKDLENDSDYLTEVRGDRQPVGRYEFATDFTTHEIDIKTGDQIIIFSDGFADQFGGPKGKKFKYKPFKRLMLDMVHLPLSEQKKQLDKFLRNWRGEHEQVDDVIVMGVKF